MLRNLIMTGVILFVLINPGFTEEPQVEVVTEKEYIVVEKYIKPEIVNEALHMVATGYSQSVEEGTEDGVTYTGLPVDTGMIAVDPKVIPLGTILWVEGYGYGIAADIGGVIKGNHIDLFFHSKEEAFDWGVREVKVVIISLPEEQLNWERGNEIARKITQMR